MNVLKIAKEDWHFVINYSPVDGRELIHPHPSKSDALRHAKDSKRRGLDADVMSLKQLLDTYTEDELARDYGIYLNQFTSSTNKSATSLRDTVIKMLDRAGLEYETDHPDEGKFAVIVVFTESDKEAGKLKSIDRMKGVELDFVDVEAVDDYGDVTRDQWVLYLDK